MENLEKENIKVMEEEFYIQDADSLQFYQISNYTSKWTKELKDASSFESYYWAEYHLKDSLEIESESLNEGHFSGRRVQIQKVFRFE